MAAARCRDYFQRVKHQKISRAPISKTAGTAPAAAKKSYASHANQRASHGHEAQHWLEAEAKLNAERKLHRAKFLLSAVI
jgi:hypothetical protein